jgi:hypothetical protein
MSNKGPLSKIHGQGYDGDSNMKGDTEERNTVSEKAGEGVSHPSGVQHTRNTASAIADDLSDDGGVGGKGEEARRERKTRSNGISCGRWQVGTHVGFGSVWRPRNIPLVVRMARDAGHYIRPHRTKGAIGCTAGGD